MAAFTQQQLHTFIKHFQEALTDIKAIKVAIINADIIKIDDSSNFNVSDLLNNIKFDQFDQAKSTGLQRAMKGIEPAVPVAGNIKKTTQQDDLINAIVLEAIFLEVASTLFNQNPEQFSNKTCIAIRAFILTDAVKTSFYTIDKPIIDLSNEHNITLHPLLTQALTDAKTRYLLSNKPYLDLLLAISAIALLLAATLFLALIISLLTITLIMAPVALVPLVVTGLALSLHMGLCFFGYLLNQLAHESTPNMDNTPESVLELNTSNEFLP